MKYFICTLFCLFSLICQANECEDQRKELNEFIQSHLRRINYCLSLYEYEGAEIEFNFNYHIGYLNGQLQVYQEVKNIIE